MFSQNVHTTTHTGNIIFVLNNTNFVYCKFRYAFIYIEDEKRCLCKVCALVFVCPQCVCVCVCVCAPCMWVRSKNIVLNVG